MKKQGPGSWIHGLKGRLSRDPVSYHEGIRERRSKGFRKVQGRKFTLLLGNWTEATLTVRRATASFYRKLKLVLGIISSALHVLTPLILETTYEAGTVMNPILQKKKVRQSMNNLSEATRCICSRAQSGPWQYRAPL